MANVAENRRKRCGASALNPAANAGNAGINQRFLTIQGINVVGRALRARRVLSDNAFWLAATARTECTPCLRTQGDNKGFGPLAPRKSHMRRWLITARWRFRLTELFVAFFGDSPAT